MGPASGKPTVPLKMLHKIRAVNMKTMTKAHSLISHTDGGKLSTRKLKQLGRNAEKETIERYEGEVVARNAMDHELPPTINVNVNINELGKLDSPVNIPQSPDEFWQSILPNGRHIQSVEPDGNCLFSSILDQLYHENGARRDFMHLQITNHINRNGDAFKHFLLLQDDHEDVSGLDRYTCKMEQNGTQGGSPRGVCSGIVLWHQHFYICTRVCQYWWVSCVQREWPKGR
jgi:hypothetical protein